MALESTIAFMQEGVNDNVCDLSPEEEHIATKFWRRIQSSANRSLAAYREEYRVLTVSQIVRRHTTCLYADFWKQTPI